MFGQTPSLLPLEERGAGESMVMTTGDFVYLYKAGGPAHRKFDCVATCFFIDTCDDLLDYIETIDGVLKDGGMWINLGPLNYKKDLKLKLAWEELQAVWEGMGYEFVQSSRVYTPYHLPAGLELYTEQVCRAPLSPSLHLRLSLGSCLLVPLPCPSGQ